MNKIYEHINAQRNGHYCHALELDSAYAFECVIESLMMELGEQFTLEDYLEFFHSIELYFLPDECSTSEWNDAAEQELYDLDITATVTECYGGML